MSIVLNWTSKTEWLYPKNLLRMVSGLCQVSDYVRISSRAILETSHLDNYNVWSPCLQSITIWLAVMDIVRIQVLILSKLMFMIWLRMQIILIFCAFFFLFHSNPVSDPETDCSFPCFSHCHQLSCLPPVLPLKLFLCHVVNCISEMTARDIKTAGHSISHVHCLH